MRTNALDQTQGPPSYTFCFQKWTKTDANMNRIILSNIFLEYSPSFQQFAADRLPEQEDIVLIFFFYTVHLQSTTKLKGEVYGTPKINCLGITHIENL